MSCRAFMSTIYARAFIRPFMASKVDKVYRIHKNLKWKKTNKMKP